MECSYVKMMISGITALWQHGNSQPKPIWVVLWHLMSSVNIRSTAHGEAKWIIGGRTRHDRGCQTDGTFHFEFVGTFDIPRSMVSCLYLRLSCAMSPGRLSFLSSRINVYISMSVTRFFLAHYVFICRSSNIHLVRRRSALGGQEDIF